MCFWPAVSGAYVGCAVCAVSAAFSSWVSFCCDCLSCTCSGGAGCLVTVFCTLLLLLFVELPWGLCCGILSLWPLVAPYTSVISRLGFSLWHLFRLGFEVLRSWLWILPSFFWGGGGTLSLVLVVLAWLLQLSCFVQVTWVSWTFCWGFFTLDFQCLLVVRGGLR